MKAIRASASCGGVTAETPRQAAEKFFAEFPNKRKCDLIEGTVDGSFFTVAYGKPWPRSWKDITKKMIPTLPDADWQLQPQ